MLSEQVQNIAREIGLFYLEKNGGDFKKTEEEIGILQISKIEIGNPDRIVIITTGRPGVLIGKRGQNIEALEKHLSRKIHIIEDMDSIYDYLVPREEEDY